MGCLESRDGFASMEKLVLGIEKMLVIKDKRLRELNFEFRNQSKDGRMSKTGLGLALTVLTRNKKYLDDV